MNKFKVEVLDVEKFVKTNDVKEISSSITFIRDAIPNTEGLLSNEIFGITKDERAGIFGYIDLGDWFLHPLIYKKWRIMDRRIENIINGNGKYSLDEKGYLVEDENGKTGMKFLKDNIDKIQFPRNSSRKRDVVIDFIEKNKKYVFMKKLIVVPAYYRDVNTGDSKTGVGDLNKLYNLLIMSVKSLKEAANYGLSMSDMTKYRIQKIILDIYNWLTSEPQLGKKNGIVRRAIMSKTTDYASRLVISAPDLIVNHYTDQVSDTDTAEVPLASLCVNLYPYMIFWLRRFFENMFSGTAEVECLVKGKIVMMEAKDPFIQFSDERLKKEMKRFIHGFSNRFTPVEIELTNGNTKPLAFIGSFGSSSSFTDTLTNTRDVEDANIFKRRLTWCDLFYMAATECSNGKHVILSRYPMDTMHNQFPNKIRVGSTKKTEPMNVGSDFYPKYPYIRDEMIGSDTGALFVDTLRVCNVMLKAIGGDYDGDQMTCKIAYSVEANQEIEGYLNSNLFLIDFGGSMLRRSSNECVQSMYNLTLQLPGTKIGRPEF